MKIVLLANTEEKRTKGLMFHKPLSKDECAFFIFNRTGQHSFWNKNVDFPISLIFINEDLVVEDIKYLEDNQTKGVKPNSYNIKYVIEAHSKAPEINDIKKGVKIKIKGKEVLFYD